MGIFSKLFSSGSQPSTAMSDSSSHTAPKLHNAMWPGLVGKQEGTENPPISLERMLELTANAEVNGRKFEGVDILLFFPHTNPDYSKNLGANPYGAQSNSVITGGVNWYPAGVKNKQVKVTGDIGWSSSDRASTAVRSASRTTATTVVWVVVASGWGASSSSCCSDHLT